MPSRRLSAPIRRRRRLAMPVIALLVVILAACGSPTGQNAPVATAIGGPPVDATASPSSGGTSLPGATDPTTSPAPATTDPTGTTPADTPAVPTPPASAGPVPTATVPVAPTPSLDPPPGPGAFEMDLYRKGDFASQATKDWCTAAAMQIMLNIVGDGRPDTTKATQAKLFELGRSNLPVRRGRGIPPYAWASALEQSGLGAYVVHAEKSRAAAIQAAARAMRLTGRPAGLVTWRGAHAWVMSGFKATADPAYTDAFRVTQIWAEDPWYPRVSSIWGASNPPHALVSLRKLAEDFLAWRRPNGRYPELNGQFVVILPVLEAPAA